ncbi:esterase OVCA2 isoform X1 [Salmo salar]|uniref:Esterase OVCA2 n=1 Tax=Salmo salar TaxID=8030 RepID=A0A1S3L2G5_SALSA|nr:esterase OVCA2 isoform X1 [Salmo salar]|eukprot:XP_013985108.1 PREDICTED: ovarian cancer-associated gene 2 protein isoform X1 [Salmo salar]
MATVTRAAPLRILCIHGYRQNSGSFREKTGALRKLLKKYVELVYMSAPHRVPQTGDAQGKENEVGPGSDEAPRGWWFSDTQARSFDAGQQCQASLGLEESVEAVRTAVKDLGPFDGVLGFSQGAALVAVLCSIQEQNLEPQFQFRFAILVAGFRSACSEHQRFYGGPASLAIPSLHIFGQEDQVIPDRMSRELLPLFQEPLVLTHPGGHFVPAASAHRQTYQEFLKRFQ